MSKDLWDVHMYACTHVCRYMGRRVCKYTDMYIWTYNGVSCSDRKMNIIKADTQRNGQLRENKIKM